MRAALARSADLAPWLWGVNGATSVCASVMGMVIALSYGIRAAFWVGVSCYALAAAMFVLSTRSARIAALGRGVDAFVKLGEPS